MINSLTGWLAEYLPKITKLLTIQYPKHAIYIPRIFDFTDNFLYKNLLSSNYRCLPTLVSYFFESSDNITRRAKKIINLIFAYWKNQSIKAFF